MTRAMAAAVVVSSLGVGAAHAVPVTLSTGPINQVVENAGVFETGFDLSGQKIGEEATLRFSFGVAPSATDEVQFLTVQLNGNEVATFAPVTNDFASDPILVEREVGGLLFTDPVFTDANPFSRNFVQFSAGDDDFGQDYVVGFVSLTYDRLAPIPLPAGAPLLAGALGLLALTRRRA